MSSKCGCGRCRSVEETSIGRGTTAIFRLFSHISPCVVAVELHQQSARIRFPCRLAGGPFAAPSRAARPRFRDGTVPYVVSGFGVVICTLLTSHVVDAPHSLWHAWVSHPYCRSKYATYWSIARTVDWMRGGLVLQFREQWKSQEGRQVPRTDAGDFVSRVHGGKELLDRIQFSVVLYL